MMILTCRDCVMACISSNSSFGRNSLDSVGRTETSAPSAWKSRILAMMHFWVTYANNSGWCLIELDILEWTHYVSLIFIITLRGLYTWRDLSTMSDPKRRISFVKISVIFDSSPPLLSLMLITKVPLLLPVKKNNLVSMNDAIKINTKSNFHQASFLDIFFTYELSARAHSRNRTSII